MEGSESEAVFDAYDLNPQRFINETLNTVDDLFDGSLDFALQKSTEIIATSDESSSTRPDDLARGVTNIFHQVIQPALDNRLEMWENYCIRQCFTVPDGFVLPKDKNNCSDGLFLQEDVNDEELDSQLDLLRNRLSMAGKKSIELHKEICSIENLLKFGQTYQSYITKVTQLLEDNNFDKMFREIGETAPKLQSKIEEIKAMIEGGSEVIDFRKKRKFAANDLGLSIRQEDIQEAANLLKNI